jgi:hypothetical protein
MTFTPESWELRGPGYGYVYSKENTRFGFSYKYPDTSAGLQMWTANTNGGGMRQDDIKFTQAQLDKAVQWLGRELIKAGVLTEFGKLVGEDAQAEDLKSVNAWLGS